MTAPYLPAPVFTWPAAPGGLLYTYAPGGVSAKTTYGEDGVTPNPNPVVLDVSGVATVRGNGLYHFLLKDSTGATTLWDADYYEAFPNSQQSLGDIITPQTPAEIAHGITPVKTWYAEGDIRRYGAVLDGSTDDTVAVQNWATVGGNLSWPVALTALISDEITLHGATTIRGSRGATITQSAADKSIFKATSQNSIHITGMHLKQTAWGAAAHVAHIFFDGCSFCSAHDNEIEGHQWVGVHLNAARHCSIKNNWFHDSFPAQSIAFTVAPVATAVSGTLTAPWTLPTGGYTVLFIETAGGAYEGRQVTLTNGATTATWSSGLANNCNAAITVQAATDSGDIVVYSSASAAASFNVIEGNFCYGNTLEVGIGILDHLGVLCTRNVIANNRINDHLGYGIVLYMTDTGDTYNQFIGNFIENITGSFALNGSSGAGIYLVGPGLGGSVVSNNIIRNCCINTQNATLIPAAIGVGTADTAGTSPVVISGNVITDMSQYHGIQVTGCPSGASITGNTIRHPSTNSTGYPISVTNSNNVSVANNIISNLTTTNAIRSIFFQSTDPAKGNLNCTITGNTITGGNAGQIETSGTGGGLTVGLTVSGNSVTGGTSSAVPLNFGSAQEVQVTGNFLTTSNNTATVNQSSCTDVIYANNRIKGGTVAMVLAGTNTGSRVDKSNLGLTPANVTNSGTGCLVEMYVTVAPAAGTQAVGDSFYQSIPTAAGGGGITGIYIWVCTVAGSVGTFKTISNT